MKNAIANNKKAAFEYYLLKNDIEVLPKLKLSEETHQKIKKHSSYIKLWFDNFPVLYTEHSSSCSCNKDPSIAMKWNCGLVSKETKFIAIHILSST